MWDWGGIWAGIWGGGDTNDVTKLVKACMANEALVAATKKKKPKSLGVLDVTILRVRMESDGRPVEYASGIKDAEIEEFMKLLPPSIKFAVDTRGDYETNVVSETSELPIELQQEIGETYGMDQGYWAGPIRATVTNERIDKKSYNGLGTVSLRIYNLHRDDAVHHTESERE